MSVFIIADPGATWRLPGESYSRSWERLKRLSHAAREAGADAFKPQFYRADLLYPKGSREHDMVKHYELPEEWLPRLKDECDAAGIEFMCTVYTPDHVAKINYLVRRHKVASFEVGHEALLEALAATAKPILISLGLGQNDLRMALHHTRVSGRLVLLHCVSAYPARPEQMNLNRLERWVGPKGLSDHTTGDAAAIMAVALGATVIEKHLRANDTPEFNPDYAHSLPGTWFGEFVEHVREAELMLGDGVAGAQPGELIEWKYDPATGLRGTKDCPT